MPAQFALVRDNSIGMAEQGDPFNDPWVGGINFSQVSDIDLDLDGDMDLFFFDRSGNKAITYLNDGIPNQVSYHYDPTYEEAWPFPILHDWVLMRDYNCDGKKDIFTYSLGGFAVYKNISTTYLEFELVEDLVYSDYLSTMANIFVTSVDIPSIDDIDGDGDLDVVTFSLFGATLEYHKNLSMEMGYGCDSLNYEIRNKCWGFFSENANNNSVTLNHFCLGNVPNPEDGSSEDGDAESEVHVGSSVTTLDLNGDGVKDLLLGDVSFNNVTALINGGTTTSGIMISQDNAFPSYDVPIDVGIFPACFFVDVNNDAKRDLIVCPNNRNLAENFTSVFYYLNTGTDAAPVFAFQKPDLFQDEMLDVGEGACPIPFDHNGDGLMDLLVNNLGYYLPGGNYPGQLALLENVGTATSPAFSIVTRDYMDLSTSGIGQAMHPAFGDLDGDGDQDMLIGDLQGRLHYFKNNSTTSTAQFQLVQPNYTDAQGNVIDVGQFATPQLFDVDGNGLLDLLIGERNGNINYFENQGTVTSPSFALEADSIGGVVVAEYWNVTGYSVPFMFMNDNGERELLVGSESGYVHHYTNIDNNLAGIFSLADSTFGGIRTGMRSGVAAIDINADQALDLFAGNYRGGLAFYRNDIHVGVAEGIRAYDPFTLVPNPAYDMVRVVPQGGWRAGMQLHVMDAMGRTAYQQSSVSPTGAIINVADWPEGMYIVETFSNGTRSSKRFMVIH